MQELERRGRRDGQDAVRGRDRSARRGERRAGDTVDAEVVDELRRAADVEQRVRRAELVEVDAVGLDAVGPGFGRGEPGEGVESDCAGRLGERRGLERAPDRAPAAVDAVLAAAKLDVESAGAPALDPADDDLDPGEAEGVRKSLDPRPVAAGVEQGGDEHVAGEPADAVEVREPGHDFTQSSRIRHTRVRISALP